MATVRFCDWLKTKLRSDEEVVTVKVGDKEFEVSQEGAAALLTRLEADDVPQVPQVKLRTLASPTAPQAAPAQAVPPVTIEAPEFEAGPGSLPEPVMAEEGVLHLEIPEDVNKRLGVPSRATYERVIQDATRFEAGTLPALSPGGARSAANQKLAAIEAAKENKLRREAGADVNFKPL